MTRCPYCRTTTDASGGWVIYDRIGPLEPNAVPEREKVAEEKQKLGQGGRLKNDSTV